VRGLRLPNRIPLSPLRTCPVVDGNIAVAKEPGLGIEVNEYVVGKEWVGS
jgi:hypothetical protein